MSKNRDHYENRRSNDPLREEGAREEVLAEAHAEESPQVTERPSPPPVVKPVSIPVQAVSPEAFVSSTPKSVPTSTPTMLPIQTELLTLSQAIDPKRPVQPRWQYALFQVLRNAIEFKDGQAFHEDWTCVLNFFELSKGTAFSDQYILRPSDDWPGSEQEFAMYRRLVHVASETSHAQTRRQKATQINLNRATEGMPEDARNRLIGYYG